MVNEYSKLLYNTTETYGYAYEPNHKTQQWGGADA